VAATLALVLAMSGGAFAARHYLINSTRQISPKVLRKLHGARGRRGVAGQNGPVGPQGVTGLTGARGTRGPQGEPGFSALSQLPAGKTESGDFAVSTQVSGEQPVSTAVVFPVPLAAPIPIEKIEFTSLGTPSSHCLGPGTASNGYLCVYVGPELNVDQETEREEKPTSTPGTPFDPEAVATVGSGKYGVGFNWKAEEDGLVRVTGTYSVTAP
jgi:Collagen triple helix repeat (20 copies)